MSPAHRSGLSASTRPRRRRSSLLCLVLAAVLGGFLDHEAAEASDSQTVLIGVGDSLTHGTMDGTNNAVNTLNAYLQRVANSLAQRITLRFSQPLLDENEKRVEPFRVPTNLGVDGADVFSVEGIAYYKRAGVAESFVSEELLADGLLPSTLDDKYDKVLYPINLLARQPVSQVDGTLWLLNQGLPSTGIDKALVIFWLGNNDSSTAALGAGGANPGFLPVPLDQVQPVMPGLTLLLRIGEQKGILSFAPYTLASIDRNLTLLDEFEEQYNRVLARLQAEGAAGGVRADVFLLTLPYYSAVGYLFDSEDLEFYLRKVNPDYTVPPSFKRVAPPGVPITDPFQGDRISLLTFGLMYALLDSGYSVEYVNQVIERDGQQRDDLVLSQAEQDYIMSRIDGFNERIKQAADSHGPQVHLIDIGQFLNDALSGKLQIQIGDHVLSRKWVRGSGFTLDGVHPSYTGQALVANFILQALNQALGLDAPLEDLPSVLAGDPYVDQDGDGWAPGPNYTATALTEMLFLFKDPDDSNPTVTPVLPPDVWAQIARALLQEILGIPAMRAEAERLGMVPRQ
jgi:hypothetical protein